MPLARTLAGVHAAGAPRGVRVGHALGCSAQVHDSRQRSLWTKPRPHYGAARRDAAAWQPPGWHGCCACCPKMHFSLVKFRRNRQLRKGSHDSTVDPTRCRAKDFGTCVRLDAPAEDSFIASNALLDPCSMKSPRRESTGWSQSLT